VSLANGKVTDLGVVGTAPRYSVPDHVIYADMSGRLWSIPFSAGKRKVTGDRTLLAEAVQVGTSGAADVAVAGGTIVYSERASVPPRSGGERYAMAIVDSTGTVKLVSSQRERFFVPRVSPDGARVAVSIIGGNTRVSDIWTFELATGGLTPVTRNGVSVAPEWTADGRRLVYADVSTFATQWMTQPWNLSAPAAPCLNPGAPSLGLSFARRGSHVAWTSQVGPSTYDIAIAPQAATSSQNAIVATPAREIAPRLSPNGRWLAYASDEASTFQVYVVPVPGPGARVPVSIADGNEPIWSVDGRTLYYVAGSYLLAARVDETQGFFVTRRDTMFALSGQGRNYVTQPAPAAPVGGFYDVFPNGDFVLLTRSAITDSTRSNVIGILNWGGR
jgi:Tol biopolymer transport system component